MATRPARPWGRGGAAVRCRPGVLGMAMTLLAAACHATSSGAAPAPVFPAGPAAPAAPADVSAGDPATGVYTPTGPLVADAGFRPDDHGFLFENYGALLADGTRPVNMTADDVRTMFGDSVCIDARAATCELLPAAEAWLRSTNREMEGGHCFGFAVAAEAFWRRHIGIDDYGASATTDLKIDSNSPLQRRIAYDWALQLLDSVRAAEITGTPNQVLRQLTKVLTPDYPETYTIAIFKADGTGGHAVTPFAVEDRGHGRFNVLIYDNNWPGVTRAIAFDTQTNSWSYDAAINPGQPDEVYRGTAKTKSLSLYPTSPGLGVQPCP